MVTFDWMLDTVSFTLLGAGYFCIPTNILELYSGMQLCGNSLMVLGVAVKMCCGAWEPDRVFQSGCVSSRCCCFLPYHVALSRPHVHVPISTALFQGTLCRPLEFSLHTATCCSGLCAAHLSCLGDPRLSALLPKSGSLLASADFHCLHNGWEAACLSGILFLVACCPVTSKTVGSYILSEFLVISGGMVIPVSETSSWP